MSSLISGIIHGDANEQNILCTKNKAGNWEVCALLDFGDSHYTAYVFDLAITMSYMILQSRDLTAGGHVLSGYCSVKSLAENEICLLQVSKTVCPS